RGASRGSTGGVDESATGSASSLVRNRPSAPDDGAHEEEQVRGALGEPPHQVRVPLGPVRRRDEHAVAAAHEGELELRADAVEHLELEPVAADLLALGEADRVLDQPLVV